MPVAEGGAALRAALRGDLPHPLRLVRRRLADPRDGRGGVATSATTYVALTDHSPRLTVANGLTPERLRTQLEIVAELNDELAPFRILTGIEVDILDDGSLDQEPELLAELDVVVASVHSKLRMPAADMTRRMVAAVANPHVDVLGHCTGRMVMGNRQAPGVGVRRRAGLRGLPAVRRRGRDQLPARAARPAAAAAAARGRDGCLFSIDTDAHAPGQLDWQPYGCARAQECGVESQTGGQHWRSTTCSPGPWTRREAAAMEGR